MATSLSKRKGQFGERIARRYFERRGWQCLGQNIHTRFGELDLVMLDGLTLVFVEVKMRRSNRFGTPEESVTQHKRTRMQTAGLIYLDRTQWQGPFRFDVITLQMRGRRCFVRHFRSAFS